MSLIKLLSNAPFLLKVYLLAIIVGFCGVLFNVYLKPPYKILFYHSYSTIPFFIGFILLFFYLSSD